MKSVLLMSFLLLQVVFGYANDQTGKNPAVIAEDHSGADGTSKLTVAPAYNGGNEAFLKFISKNIRYPQTARDNKTQGRVIVRFRVDADGTVKDAMVPEGMGIGYGCDEEAIRVVMLSSKWKPATRLGTPATMWYEVPIVFALTEVK